MREMCKTIAYDVFQKLIVLSVFLIPCFFWPQHEVRLMKFICLQTFTMILLAFSFMFTSKRSIDNFYPALFLILGFLNLFTHGMSDFVNIGVNFIFISVVGIYVISNHLDQSYIPIIKKAIVLMCLANCVLFLTQKYGLNIVFTIGPHERPCGFMSYPANFGLLCAISVILTWQWHKWLIIPIGTCLWLSHEYSVILGLFTGLSMVFFKGYWKMLFPVALIGVCFFLWHRSFTDSASIQGKIDLRLKYLYPVLVNVWARPIDGWGVGMYNRLPDRFFGFARGNWSEMHCEPLDCFFCMGFAGVACITGWILTSFKSMSNFYKMIFITFGTVACFHSPFHFADSLFLAILLISLFEVEKYDTTY
jgi:hypothetical protein